jgi:hypothetical protein
VKPVHVVLDRELVAVDSHGRPSFQALQHRDVRPGAKDHRAPVGRTVAAVASIGRQVVIGRIKPEHRVSGTGNKPRCKECIASAPSTRLFTRFPK